MKQAISEQKFFEIDEQYAEQYKWYNRYTVLTDAYVAEEIAGRYGHVLQYCRGWGWMYYNGKYWQRDAKLDASTITEMVVREMIDEANAITDVKAAHAAVSLVLPYLNQYKLVSALDAAARKTNIHSDEFDCQPYLLNVDNGTIDLENMSFGEHRKEFMLTKCAPVTYDKDASCPRWMEFIYEVTGGNDDLMKFLQRVVGYSLSDDTSERVFFILYGSGFNGKTTFLETILAMLGENGYAMTTPVETFMATRGGGVPSDVARLRGSRFVYATEGELGQRLAESCIKRLTGQDTITARFLFKEWFDFKPTFKLFLGTNHRPKMRGTDDAIWDRIRLIPFTQCFRDKADPDLQKKLKGELSGILNWAIEGFEMWQQDRLGYPEEVQQATREYRSDMDILGSFIGECCDLGNGYKVGSQLLHDAYKKWCEVTGERELKRSDFYTSLEERGFIRQKERDGAKWYRIKLKDI